MSKMFLGIDLGTTYSVGAFINKDGEAETIINAESERITPSVVYFESKDSVVVGQPAKDNSCMCPQDVISLVKNSMGKKNPDGSVITFQTSFGEFTPEVVSSFILKKIVSDANVYLQPKEPITDVVVTIPAYFNDAQRKATDNAINIAGLNRIGMINEPTAAAFYYAHTSNLTVGDVLVYDLGGGTFDVTIVHIDHGNVEVRSTGGLNKVGGSYFDKKIVQTICTDFEQKHGIDLTTAGYEDILQDLYTKVEKAKIQLSSATSARIIVRAEKESENYTLTREDLDEIVKDLYQKTESVMKKALRDAGLKKEEMTKVILVGGSSRIPYIYEHVKEFFGIEPSREVNPNEVVALGAALYAKQLVDGQGQKIVDVCSHGIGVRALDPKTGEEYNDILFKRNTKLPAMMEKTYQLGADDADTLYLNVLEGDYREITDVSEICEVDVELPKKLKKGTKVCIRIEVDVYQLLHIYIRIPEAGNVEKEVTFDRKSNLSEAEVTQWKKAAQKAVESIDEKNGIGGFLSGLFGKKAGSEAPAGDAIAKEEDTTLIRPESKKTDNLPKKDKSAAIPKIVQTMMQDYVGMVEVQETLRDYKNRYDMQEKRSVFGKSENEDRCIAVCGTHGAGMTTAAYLIARCLYKFGITALDQPVVAEYEDIVKEDEQKTVEAIQTLFQQAMNGVLIIEDFDRFYNDNENAAGMLAVNYLLKAYHEAQKKVTLVVEGEGKEIKELFEKKERFSRLFNSYTIDMVGYSADEYVQILHKIAESMGYVVDNLADAALERHIKGESKLPGFGQIHYIESLLDRAKTDVANKASKKRHATDDDYMIIRLENFRLAAGNKSLEELLEELHQLTGLSSVKAQVDSMVKAIQLRKRAEAEGKELPTGMGTMHMLFLGAAGTGKTTVARLVGEIYRELGVLTRGHMVEVLRKDLVSEFVGKTAQVVGDKVSEAMGGILFIDEAYSLCRGDDDTFGKEAVDALVPLLENHRNDFVTILAGYTEDMNRFLDNNQGLKSRFPNVITFENYTIEELMSIFTGIVTSDGYSIEGRAMDVVKELLKQEMKKPNFGNGRDVRNLYEKIRTAQRNRIAELSDWGEGEQLIIRTQDCATAGNVLGDEQTTDQILAELEAMTGLASVKKEVQTLVNAAKVNAMRKANGLPELGNGTLHMVFAGNPGTGKTTVARMIGKIYKSLGVLAREDVIEVTRSDLVANYVGQTAAKTVGVVNSALGGVLFIDEAYQLGEGGENDFGREAISTLVQELENHRNDFVCIVAGYTKDMQEKFMSVNPGLPSRFPRTIIFEDYTVEEKLDIFTKSMEKQKLVLGDGALHAVKALFERVGNSDKYANGRGVRTIGEEIVKNMNDRVIAMSMDGHMPTMEDMVTILPEDVSL